MNKILFKSILPLAAVLVMLVIGCKDDPVTPETKNAIASFQYEISTTDFLEVSFSNFSQNATSYSWDFGDGNSSTEKDPTHNYSAAGEYTVTLTATGDNSATKSETFTLTNPNSALELLAGTDSKTWHLQREGVALGIGPGPGNNEWWSFGGVTPLGDRPCILDDSYTFHVDGTWEKNTNGTIFVDSKANGGWFADGIGENCYDESDMGVFTSEAGDDLSAFANGGSYTYEYDAAAGSLTILGEGAYIGLANKTGDGDNFIPSSAKTYTVFNIAEGDVADTLQVALFGSVSWNFFLVSYKNPADLPDLPSVMPTANFTYAKNGAEVTFTNNSINSTSYSWDFGDGNMSTEESPTHTYTADGDYTVTLTANDDMGGSNMKSEVISISSAVFTAAALSSADGKTWKLDGANSYFVGPTPGSNEWWPGVDNPDDRACIFDDEFTFKDDGTYEFDSKGAVWSEAYMGGADACVDDADIPAQFSALGSGSHTFTATDNSITVSGLGAYIAFSKPFNGGELDGMLDPLSEITYEVIDYSNNAGVERMTITIDYSAGQVGEGYWTMRMISQN